MEEVYASEQDSELRTKHRSDPRMTKRLKSTSQNSRARLNVFNLGGDVPIKPIIIQDTIALVLCDL